MLWGVPRLSPGLGRIQAVANGHIDFAEPAAPVRYESRLSPGVPFPCVHSLLTHRCSLAYLRMCKKLSCGPPELPRSPGGLEPSSALQRTAPGTPLLRPGGGGGRGSASYLNGLLLGSTVSREARIHLISNFPRQLSFPNPAGALYLPLRKARRGAGLLVGHRALCRRVHGTAPFDPSARLCAAGAEHCRAPSVLCTDPRFAPFFFP